MESQSSTVVSEELKEQEECSLRDEKKIAKEEKEENARQEEARRLKGLMNLLHHSQHYAEFLGSKLVVNKDKSTLSSKGRKSKRSALISRALKESNAENTMKGEDTPDSFSKSFDKLFVGGQLRDYQQEGLDWLINVHMTGINAILADEMGLGKTVQVIAFICWLLQNDIRGPFLVVAPLSTLPNWALEFERFAPQVPVLLLYGNKATRNSKLRRMRQHTQLLGKPVLPVVITSYQMPLMERSALRSMSWKYIVVDEGHRLKNSRCQLSMELRQYTSVNRLLLTGTPLQNNLPELWSLLNFLMPEVFFDLAVFSSWFDVTEMSSENAAAKIVQMEEKNQILSTMHKILSPFMLRRVKTSVALNLPAKKEVLVYAPLTELQEKLYRATLDRDFATLTHTPKEEIDINAPRQKRRCTMKPAAKEIDFGDDSSDEEIAVGSSKARRRCSVVEEADFGDVSSDSKLPKLLENSLDGDLDEELEQEDKYFFSVKMQNAAMQLRKIVNHPYLVHWPQDVRTGQPRVAEDMVRASGKLQVLDVMLDRLHRRGHRVLLFSTFTMVLDLLEDYLSLRPYKYLRLDGNTPLDNRMRDIKQFNSDPGIFLFLISTRAGGLGINLTGADTVVIYDSDWNPQVDLQAQDRCHRIGQTRPVVVYRLVTADSVDQKMVERASAKRKLEKMVIEQGNYRPNGITLGRKVNCEELLELLNSREHQGVFQSGSSVFTDQQWNDLLDRSNMTGPPDPNTSQVFKLVQ